ncbi:hypothetical protein [Streptomyces purpureus]|uniref:Uncharacterized protein n=1 Tax=Streptomyces purpureus TaxID=1951 RepID=A0A918H887_9ACTN|nr:hypothetical protein [Streptomyces purpureus]GGT45384.1 hypothetical protein GCM10014713_44110 [Streptomyces purpureus]
MSTAGPLSSWHRPLVWFAGSMVVMTFVSIGGLIVDDRVLTGAPIWFKPLKFSVSFVAYALSLAWMLSLLTRARRVGWWAGTVVVVASAVEMVLITTQVFRGKRSHFNVATPFDSAIFNAMGITVAVLWGGALVIAILLFRARIADRASAWAVRLGAVIALAGAGVGFLMTQPTPEQRAAGGRDGSDFVGAHSVGVADGGPSMPLTGWSTTGGDLRIGHFVGMHALQALPLVLLLLAALAPRFTRLRDDRVRTRMTLLAAGTYAALFLLVTWQALRGQSLIHPDAPTLTTLALILAGAAAASWASVAVRGRPPVDTATAPATNSGTKTGVSA